MAVIDIMRSAGYAQRGYIIPTEAPYNCVGNGIADDWAGLQAAVNAAIDQRKSVYLPGNKVYRISKTLRCEVFQHRVANPVDYFSRIFGGNEGGVRPKILLAPNASGFNSVASPRPVVYFNNWQPNANLVNANPRPPNLDLQNPYTTDPTMTIQGVTYTWQPWAANLYKCAFINVDVDTNGNPGADGLAFLVAQDAYLFDVKITATGSNVALRGGSGRSCPAGNLELVGGRYAISNDHPRRDGCAGTLYVGVKAYGQTVGVLEQFDESNNCILVGFDITTNNIPVFNASSDFSAASSNSFLLIDGIVRETGSATNTLFRNPNGKTCYIRNVYVTGTSNLISHPSGTVTGSGTWKRIAEYSQNDMKYGLPNTSADETLTMPSYSIVDNVKARIAQPFTPVVQNNVSAPGDMIAAHYKPFQWYRDDMIVATAAPYNADSTGATDSVAALEAAFLAAETAGHNTVFLPPGTYRVSRTLNLRSHTKLIGSGSPRPSNFPHNGTKIRPTDNWVPTSTNEYIIATPADASATCEISFIGINKPSNGSFPGKFTYYHNDILWRSGKNSQYRAVALIKDWEPEAVGTAKLAPQMCLVVSGPTAGGRFFGLATPNGDQYSNANTRSMYVVNTSQPIHFYGMQCEITKSGERAEGNAVVRNSSNVRFYGAKREGYSPSLVIEDSSNIAHYGLTTDFNFFTYPAYFWLKGTVNNVVFASLNVRRNPSSSQWRTGTYSQVGTTITVSLTPHWQESGDSIFLNFTTGGATSGVYVVTGVTNANTFTITAPDSATRSGNVTCMVRSDMVRDDSTTGAKSQVDGPFSVSYFRKGTLDDSVMEIPSIPAPPPFQSVSPGTAARGPGESVALTISPSNQTPTGATLAGIAVSLSGTSPGGATVAMPSKSDLLTGAFKNVDWFTPLDLELTFPSADPVQATITLNGPAPANSPGAFNFWGRREIPGEPGGEE